MDHVPSHDVVYATSLCQRPRALVHRRTDDVVRTTSEAQMATDEVHGRTATSRCSRDSVDWTTDDVDCTTYVVHDRTAVSHRTSADVIFSRDTGMTSCAPCAERRLLTVN
jgi:hypothetical protein